MLGYANINDIINSTITRKNSVFETISIHKKSARAQKHQKRENRIVYAVAQHAKVMLKGMGESKPVHPQGLIDRQKKCNAEIKG